MGMKNGDNKMELPDWFFYENGKFYWEWRHAYRKVLEDIIRKKEHWKRHHISSDQQFVELLRENIHSCQLWLEEMRCPKEARMPNIPNLCLDFDLQFTTT
jgi:hypothetical protein